MYLMFIGPCIIAIVEEWKTNLRSLVILFHLLCAQHVSDITISIFRSLRLCWRITTSVVLFSVCCVLEFLLRLIFGGVRFAVLQPAKRTPPNISRSKNSNTQRTENNTTDVVIHQQSRRLLKMNIVMSETCWAHNKWNKITSDIKLVFHSSTPNFVHQIYGEYWTNRTTQLRNGKKYPGVADSENIRTDILYKFRLLVTPLWGHTETCDPLERVRGK